MASRVVYDDFEPSTEVIQENDCETFIFNLPDFKKEQLRVQLTTSNTLRVTGNRQISDNKHRRFLKEVPVSTNCNMQKISAKFENGKLFIRLPKLIVEEDKKPEPSLMVPSQKPEPPREAHEGSQKPASKEPTFGQDNASTVVSSSGIDQDGPEKKTSMAHDKERDNDVDDKERAEEEKKKDKQAREQDDAKARIIAKYKDTAGNIATKLKKPRSITNAVLVAIVLVSIGLYISKVIGSCKVDVICT